MITSERTWVPRKERAHPTGDSCNEVWRWIRHTLVVRSKYWRLWREKVCKKRRMLSPLACWPLSHTLAGVTPWDQTDLGHNHESKTIQQAYVLVPIRAKYQRDWGGLIVKRSPDFMYWPLNHTLVLKVKVMLKVETLWYEIQLSPEGGHSGIEKRDRILAARLHTCSWGLRSQESNDWSRILMNYILRKPWHWSVIQKRNQHEAVEAWDPKSNLRACQVTRVHCVRAPTSMSVKASW